jgi:hypothetical protein
LYPDYAKSQTGYVFLYGNTAISWKSTKETLTCTSSNHAEIIALHEASRECIWLECIMDYMNVQYNLRVLTKPIILFEDNSACVEQVSKGFIKEDIIKHIAPKFFFTHEQQGYHSSADHCREKILTMQINLPSHFPPVVYQFHCQATGLRKISKLIEQSNI